ncbi:MAG: carbohydrate-binding module family 20 domain-containing protein, partial [Deltaproteobacteria bacterium]
PDRIALALATLLSLRGIPCLTYGTEAGLTGAADPDNRRDLELPVRSPLRAIVASLTEVRAAHPALASGETAVLEASRDAVGLLRLSPGEMAWVALGRGALPPPPREASGHWTRALRRRAGQLALDVFVARPTEAVRALVSATEAARPVRFSAVGAPRLGHGDALAVVGSAPELGGWNPGGGVNVGDDVPLPAGAAYEVKLVVRRAAGGVEWQAGPNEVVYVPRGPSAQAIPLRWSTAG